MSREDPWRALVSRALTTNDKFVGPMEHRLEGWSRGNKRLAWRAILRARYLSSDKRRPDQAILVLSTYRTGSTLLIDYLNTLEIGK